MEAMSATTAGACPLCGGSYHLRPAHGYGLCTQERGTYQFTPNPLTESDIRRIVREELKRAKGKP